MRELWRDGGTESKVKRNGQEEGEAEKEKEKD